MKAVITGGCGFIGSNLVKDAVKRNWDVVVYDNFSRFAPDHLGKYKEAVSIVKGEIQDLPALRKVLNGADVVFHLAAASRQSGSIESPETYFVPNTLGTYNVAEACRTSSTRIIFTSTWVVYERKNEDIPTQFNENSALGPSNPYAMSKKHGEDWLNLYHDLYGEDSVIFRLSNIYGPGDKNRIIPSIIDRARSGDDIVVFGNVRLLNFVHVDDLVDAFVAASTRKTMHNRTLNIGSVPSVTMKDVADRIVRATSSKSRVRVEPLPDWEHPYYVPDTSLAEKEMGFKAKKTLDAGIEEMVRLESLSPLEISGPL
jgi:nucleoside-diphosphate-sugar epimerase